MATSITEIGTVILYSKTTSGADDADIFWPGGGTSAAETPLYTIKAIHLVLNHGPQAAGDFDFILKDGLNEKYCFWAKLEYDGTAMRKTYTATFNEGFNIHGLFFDNSLISAGIDAFLYIG